MDTRRSNSVVSSQKCASSSKELKKIATMLVTLLVIGVVAGSLAVIVQPFVTPTPSTPPPIDPARLEAHVKRLSVDFHPRRYDRPDNIARTVEYISDELKSTGAAIATQD